MYGNAAFNNCQTAPVRELADPQKVSPVRGAVDEVHASNARTHNLLDVLEGAMGAVLRPEPEAGKAGELPAEMPQSPLHAELLQAANAGFSIERRIDRLIQRLTL